MKPKPSPLVWASFGIPPPLLRAWILGLALSLTATWVGAQTYTYSGVSNGMVQSQAKTNSYNTVVWNITGGYFNSPTPNSQSFANTNLVFDNVALNNGYSTSITTFTSATTVTGAGTFALTGPALAHDFVFAGNMTGYTGNINIDPRAEDRTTTLGYGFNSVVQFGGVTSGGTKALGTVTGTGPNRVINNVAGSGSIVANVLVFNYGTDASYDSVKVTNAIAQRAGIHFIGNANVEASGPISDATGVSTGNALTKSGSGILTLSGTNTYTGATNLTAGTLKIGAGGTTGSIASTSGVINGGALIYDRSDNLTAAYVTSGTGTLTKQGAGVLTLTGANTYTGVTTISAGTLQLGAGGTTGSLAPASSITVGSGGTFAINRSDTVTQGTQFSTAPITGLGGFSQIGSGTTILNKNNTYTGVTTINSGTLRLVGGGAIADTGAVVLANTSGATLNIQNSETIGSLAGGGLSGGNVTINSGQTLTTGAANTSTTFAGIISGAASFTKTGSGTQTLTGANTYTGATTISAGTLQLGAGGTTGSLAPASTITVASGATFAVNRNDTVTQGTQFSTAAITGDGGFSQIGSGTTILNADNTYKGATTVSAGTLLINGDQTSATGPVNVAAGATLGGSGKIGGDTTINGGTHAPGGVDSTGVLTHLGTVTYAAGSKVEWELTKNEASTALQPGAFYFDQIKVNGDLNFAPATTMNLTFNSTGSAVDWDSAFWDMPTVIDWLVYDVTGEISGFSNLSLSDPATWIDKDGVSFNSPLGPGRPADANFYLYQSGNSIYLRYEAIPEPAGFALLALALGLMTVWIRPRRRLVVT